VVENEGGVDMLWEEVDPQYGAELSEEEARLHQEEQLVQKSLALEEAFVELFQQARQLAEEKTLFHREQGQAGLAQVREEVLRPASEGGTFMGQLTMEQGVREAVKFQAVDLLLGAEEEWQAKVEAIQATMLPSKLNGTDVSQILEATTGALNRSVGLKEDLSEERLGELVERHSALASGLVGVKTISRDTGRLFPKDKSMAIML
jgi:hypothetical protein